MLNIIGAGFCYFTLGSMILFGAVVAPAVFQTLPADHAGAFLRRVFPRMYLFCGITTSIATGLFTAANAFELAVVAGISTVLFFVSRGPLTRQINEARDQELAGVPGARETFERLHKLSVRVFGLQALMILCAGIYAFTI